MTGGGVPIVAQWKQIRLGTMRLRIQSLALLSGLRIRCCCELWCRSQMRLRSDVAVAVVQASSYSSDSTPSLGTSICCRCGPKKTKRPKKKKKVTKKNLPYSTGNSTQYLVITYMEENLNKNICVCNRIICLHLKLTQHCKSTILQ